MAMKKLVQSMALGGGDAGEGETTMRKVMSGRRLAIAGVLGAALLAAAGFGSGPVALGQDQSAAVPKDVIFARKILMDTINENMDDLEAMVAQGKIDLAEGTAHSNIVSVMLMAFPHLFPPTTNEWKPGGEKDPGTDTYASPDIWRRYADFYKMAETATQAAFKASRAHNDDEFKTHIGELRNACNACHEAFLKKD
jgi:cytochrome c556